MTSKLLSIINKLAVSIKATTLEDIVRAICTIGSVGASIYLWIARGSVPSELLGLTTLFVGYFFGRVQSLYSGTSGGAFALNRSDG